MLVKINGLLAQSEVLLELGFLTHQVVLCAVTPSSSIGLHGHRKALGNCVSVGVSFGQDSYTQSSRMRNSFLGKTTSQPLSIQPSQSCSVSLLLQRKHRNIGWRHSAGSAVFMRGGKLADLMLKMVW